MTAAVRSIAVICVSAMARPVAWKHKASNPKCVAVEGAQWLVVALFKNRPCEPVCQHLNY